MYAQRSYQEHTLVFALCARRWPSKDIDHVNGIRSDNRFENLREVTDSQNHQNRHRANCNSKSMVLGVHFDRGRGKWRAKLKLNGSQKHLGYFNSLHDAAAARLLAEQTMFTHSPRGL